MSAEADVQSTTAPLWLALFDQLETLVHVVHVHGLCGRSVDLESVLVLLKKHNGLAKDVAFKVEPGRFFSPQDLEAARTLLEKVLLHLPISFVRLSLAHLLSFARHAGLLVTPQRIASGFFSLGDFGADIAERLAWLVINPQILAALDKELEP
jgi:hypothetical protein